MPKKKIVRGSALSETRSKPGLAAKPAPAAKPAFGSKSAFVRGLPMDAPAKDVVAQAKAQGMKLSVAQVYNIRSTAKLKKTARVSPAAPGVRVARVSSGDSEARLRRLIADVGLTRSKEILNEVLAAFGV